MRATRLTQREFARWARASSSLSFLTFTGHSIVIAEFSERHSSYDVAVAQSVW